MQTKRDMLHALEQAFTYGHEVLVEEYILDGKEIVLLTLEGFRGEDVYVLPPVEVVPPQRSSTSTVNRPRGGIYDFAAKLDTSVYCQSPATLGHTQKEELTQLARTIHTTLGLGQHAVIDCIVSPRRGISVLEVNTVPSYADSAPLAIALDAVGAHNAVLVDHMAKKLLSR